MLVNLAKHRPKNVDAQIFYVSNNDYHMSCNIVTRVSDTIAIYKRKSVGETSLYEMLSNEMTRKDDELWEHWQVWNCNKTGQHQSAENFHGNSNLSMVGQKSFGSAPNQFENVAALELRRTYQPVSLPDEERRPTNLHEHCLTTQNKTKGRPDKIKV